MSFLSSGNGNSAGSTKVSTPTSSNGLFSLKKKFFKSSTTSVISLNSRDVRNVSGAPVTSMKTKKMMKQNSNPFINSNSNLPSPPRKGSNNVTPKRSNSMTNNYNTATNNNSNSNTHNWESKEKPIVYNPYGMSNNSSMTNSGAPGSFSNPNDISFYMHDGGAKIRLLPIPILDPNTFLPDNFAQRSVLLNDNFILDKENKTLGSGGSCEVRKIRSIYRAKNVYALKKLNLIYQETPEQFYKRCSKEFIIAKSLSHNIHIINTFCIMKVPTTTYTTRGWGVVMELGEGDLFQLIEKSGWKNVPLPEKFCLFKQIANGIKFCHENGIAHRDLKPENVLLSKDGVCKLTDFGISDWYHEIPNDFTSPVKTCQGMIGSPPYAPPEVMYFDSKKKYSENLQKPYNPLALDCYALGIILFTLVNGTTPFFESCNTDTRFRSFETSYDNFIAYQNKYFRKGGVYKPGPGSEYSLSKNFRDEHASRVAWRLSDPKVETRYTLEDLYEDPWFKSIQTCAEMHDDYNTEQPDIRPPKRTEEYTTSSANSIKSNVEEKHNNEHVIYMNNTLESFKEEIKNGNDLLRDTLNNHSPVGHNGIIPSMTTTLKSKPRSMVDIAHSPQINKSGSKPSDSDHAENEGQDANLFTLDEDSVKEKLEELLAENEVSPPAGSFSSNKITTPVPITSPVPNRILNNNALNSEPSIPSTISSPSQSYIPIVSTSSSSASSFRSNMSVSRGKLRNKQLIHNHMNVVNSITSMSGSRSFSLK
ncbi:hypothetical protein TPHA_0F03520 [Tetrapisispora phaffii CBS 4417]|uniref:non-specific serine/threonine protein kinase n=1 Tax=Tetrapisispora phaffii (strain ATCC 24235 / CBS 4417 / NBRC 1672 / NRRL Y-8282 / UCD 70-5) TaxID=1071381 RepID=G8BUP6_TETPH|nr:hypothetical protein TPHA_0F03520 [Tetrapisispora phaffii CBS 4417]CCE63832.1 hypothetical protein TPHA_0F03520 [Tetrapisispora phaffii CBS 4417]